MSKPHKTERGRCLACGSEIKEHMYQARAADEAHTSIWSCDNCPVDASRVSTSIPRQSPHTSFPRRLHVRVPSNEKCPSHRSSVKVSCLEVSLADVPHSFVGVERKQNIRVPCIVPGEGPLAHYRAHYLKSGAYQGNVIRLGGSESLSPRCAIQIVYTYGQQDQPDGCEEVDGTVSEVELGAELKAYFYHRVIAGHHNYTLSIPMGQVRWPYVRDTLMLMQCLGIHWPGILGFVTRDKLGSINNLSPRAWDSKRIQKRGAVYTPKVDGERVYVLVYGGVAHVFSRGGKYSHIGLRVVERPIDGGLVVVVDAENTVSHGLVFIDMLTDSNGKAAPRERDIKWSLEEFRKLTSRSGGMIVSMKPYTDSLVEAERISSMSLYPTDGIVGIWPGTTTSRKIKSIKSIELELLEDMSLATSDGDVVVKGVDVPRGTVKGDILEVRFKLNRDGSSIRALPLFKRTDKLKANSTSAVSAVLSSFSTVKKDDETRRRGALMWCESLKQHLFKKMLDLKGSKKIVLDIGTGTGQSLDVLSSERGVSYILVEPDEGRCKSLQRRTGVKKVVSDPRDLMFEVRALKLGIRTYAVANMELCAITSDEDLMRVLKEEVAFVTATFSAHFVVQELYYICTYWSLPMVGCLYAYDEVEVGECLVNTLGVKMKRISPVTCEVKWGGDHVYTEPYVTTLEYRSFCTPVKAIEILQPPNRDLDRDVWDICSKVYVVENLT